MTGRRVADRADALAASLATTPALALISGPSTTAMLILTVLALAATVRQRLPFSAMHLSSARTRVLVLAAAAWAALSCTWTPTPPSQAVETLMSVGALIALGGFGLAAAPALDAEERRRIGVALAIGIAIAAFALLVESVSGFPAMRATYPGILVEGAASRLSRGAAVIALLLWPCLAILPRMPAIALAALVGLALLALGKPAVLAAFAAGAAAAALAWAWAGRGGRLMAAALAALVLIGPGIAHLTPKGQVLALDNQPNSAVHRAIIIHFVADRIAERPWIGWGMDASRSIPGGDVATTVRLGPYPGRNQDKNFTNLPLHPHNNMLQIWLELGLPGAVLVALAVWRVGVRVDQAKGTAGHAAARVGAMAAAATVASLSYGVWQSWWLALLWQVAIAFAIVVPSRDQTETSSTP